MEELRALGRRTAHEPADFADPAAPERVVDAAVAASATSTCSWPITHAQAVRRLSSHGEELDRSYAVNTRATLLLVKAFAAQHDGRDGGSVVLLTSGQYAGPMPDELPYIASKGALHQVTASLARYLAPRRITVNTVYPGATTPATPAQPPMTPSSPRNLWPAGASPTTPPEALIRSVELARPVGYAMGLSGPPASAPASIHGGLTFRPCVSWTSTSSSSPSSRVAGS